MVRKEVVRNEGRDVFCSDWIERSENKLKGFLGAF